MTNNPWRRVLEIVRRQADPDAAGPLADERLLARFVANGDPSAFELLVWRHGSLVFGTCRRILNDVHAAEDAFQATFLALARKPRAVRSGASLAGWLHRVALRISNKVRVSRALQSRAELGAAQDCAVSPADIEQHEIAAVVDQEIDRLPDRLRRAVVLCYLDGQTTEQAAAILACPRGTVLSRLHTARERLRGRLTRRGLALPAAGIFALIFASESPATLVPLAVRAALTGTSPVLTGLVQGVFHAMFMTKVKIVTAVFLGVGLVGGGVGWAVVPGSGPAVLQAEESRQPVKPSAADIAELQKKFDDANARTLELFLDAKKILTEQLEHAEQAHQDFRQKSPFNFVRGGNPRARYESIESKRTDLQLKKIELESRLATVKAVLNPNEPLGNQEQAAQSALIRLQMRGVDVAAMRKAIAKEIRNVSAPEFVLHYTDAIQFELDELNRTAKILDELSDREQRTLRELSYTELQDERLRNKIIQSRLLLEALTKHLAEITLFRTEKGK